MANVRTALKFSLITQYAFRLLSLANVVFIARMLTPDELGVYAVAAAVAMVAAQLKSFGVSEYLIKEEVLTESTVRSSLGLNVMVSWGLGVLLIALAWPIQLFYQMDDMAILLGLLSVSFFVAPHIGLAQSLMARKFNFVHRLYINLGGQVVNLAATIVFILLGHSYFSLAYGAAIGILTEFTLAVLLRPTEFKFMPQFSGTKKIAKFGMFVTFSHLLKYVNFELPVLMIGKMGSTAQVANFSRASGFLDFVSNSIGGGIRPVALPYLSYQKREQNDVQAAFKRANELIGALLIPTAIVAGLASYPVIMMFFGDQWGMAAELVSILAVWSAIKSINVLTQPLLITFGHEKHMFYQQLFTFMCIMLGIYLTFPYGLEAVAWVVVAAAVLEYVYLAQLLKIKFNFSFFALIVFNKQNFIVTAVCAAITVGLGHVINYQTTSPFLSVSLIIVLVGIGWLLSLVALKHPLVDEMKKLLPASLQSKFS